MARRHGLRKSRLFRSEMFQKFNLVGRLACHTHPRKHYMTYRTKRALTKTGRDHRPGSTFCTRPGTWGPECSTRTDEKEREREREVGFSLAELDEQSRGGRGPGSPLRRRSRTRSPRSPSGRRASGTSRIFSSASSGPPPAAAPRHPLPRPPRRRTATLNRTEPIEPTEEWRESRSRSAVRSRSIPSSGRARGVPSHNSNNKERHGLECFS